MYLGDELVGKFFLDMHPRDKKFKHAAMFGIQTGLSDGQIPIATLVCNFPNPKNNNGLMEHTQVTTYFHEFGHLIHHLMARSHKWVTQGGITTEWDFVEAPSQILEEWAWAPEVLARFAKHVESGKTIPAELVEKLRKSEDFGKAAWVMRQVFYMAYSYFIHAQDPKGMDLDAFTDDIYKNYSPYPRVPDSAVYSNFGHLMGYSSVYYTYMWSLVIAKDLFTRFESVGMMNKEVAKDYRTLILEPGGSRDASDLIRDFLGREYTMDAFKKWLNGN
jgi:thimet oligopeptidase